MALIAARVMNIHGQPFTPGDVVPPALLDPLKLSQLVEQRRIIDTDASTSGIFRAMRTFPVEAQTFRRGDLVSPDLFDPIKFSQLLEHRYIEPTVRVADPSAAPSSAMSDAPASEPSRVGRSGASGKKR